jgi:hypothetical protein
VVVVGDLGDRPHVRGRVARTERVQRVDQQDHPGLRGDRCLDPVRREPVRCLVDVEVDGARAAERDEPVDDQVARVGRDHLVAGLQQRPGEHVERFRPPGGDEAPRLGPHAEILPHEVVKLGEPGRERISLVLAVRQGLVDRGPDHRRRGEMVGVLAHPDHPVPPGMRVLERRERGRRGHRGSNSGRT